MTPQEPDRDAGGRPVGLALDRGVARIHLDDPRHRNALSRRLSDDLAAAVDDAPAGGSARRGRRRWCCAATR
jgi:enoyl-CoA hydratase/carnithine racemase